MTNDAFREQVCKGGASMNRPMTLEAVTQYIGPIYYQQRFCRFVDCVVYQGEHMPNFVFRVITHYDSNRHIKAPSETYGAGWRCWKNRPSTEEMAIPFERY